MMPIVFEPEIPQARAEQTMSIATRTGDDGTTGLMYNRRVPKTHPRVEAYGAVDELNAMMGLARSFSRDPFVSGHLLRLQKDLINLMGELATDCADLPRFLKDGYSRVTREMVVPLDDLVKEIEAQGMTFRGWAIPGANSTAGALDVARTTCRRAERLACRLEEEKRLENPDVIRYLNRLSDVLWLLARHAERPADPPSC